MKSVLNIGGNSKLIEIPSMFKGWKHEILDIDPSAEPDICMDARELLSTEIDKKYDAVYCSHNLEHYFEHDVEKVIKGMLTVLNENGFAFIRVPDIEAVCKEIANGMDIEDTLYYAGENAIRIKDVMYGWSKVISENGNDYFAHKTAFTKQSLNRVLKDCGFEYVLFCTYDYEIAALALTKRNDELINSLLGEIDAKD